MVTNTNVLPNTKQHLPLCYTVTVKLSADVGTKKGLIYN